MTDKPRKGWEGWENFTGETTPSPRPWPPPRVPRPPNKYHALATLVLDDFTVIDADRLRELAKDRDVPTTVPKKNRHGRTIESFRPLKLVALDLNLRGTWFASKLEARAWVDLMGMWRSGRITNLRRQVHFLLHAAPREGFMPEVVGRYIADFVYEKDGRTLVVDVKGVTTPLFHWKAKHFELEYGFAITVV